MKKLVLRTIKKQHIRIMDDVKNGTINVIVAFKMDRRTRSVMM